MPQNIPSYSRSKSVYTVSTFQGVNYTDDPSNVDTSKSPYAPNMIRDVPGKVRKCMGYHTVQTFADSDGNPLQINGFHKLRGSADYLIHAGTNIYKVDAETSAHTLLYSDAANERSRSFQFSVASETAGSAPTQELVIQDGKALLIYNGTTIVTAQSVAKIPTITIAKGSDKSTSYDAVNLLQPKYRESFYSSTMTSFTMSLAPLDASSPVVVEWKNASNEWQDISSKVSSVNYETGTVVLTSAQPVSVTGEDNIRITVQHTVAGYADRVNKCTVSIPFGVNGATDRLFVGGNPDTAYLNYDWFSGQNDPTYWPDTGYSSVGNPGSAIMGYSIVNNYLATHKDNMETDRNIVIRQGNLVDSEPAFPIVNTLQGPGAISKWSFQYLETEPLFLTKSGVFAITTSDLSGERYSQRRSYYINGALLEEPDLEDAYSCTHNDMYWLCVNGKAYILDGLQAIQSGKSDPYSTRQYACFERTNLSARVMWEDSNLHLFFGTDDGKICAFYTNPDTVASYNDDGLAIQACWRTPDFSGNYFFKNKSFKYLAAQISSAAASEVEMWGVKLGIWELLHTSSESLFSFAEIVFSAFTFTTDSSTKTMHTKTRIKKADKTAYEFRNNRLDQPFGLMAFAFEYIENGNYKK